MARPHPLTRWRCARLGWRWLLAGLLLATLQHPIGALLVPALASAPVVEVCTPNGPQWVVLDTQDGEDESAPVQPLGSNGACVWAMAHLGLTSGGTAPAALRAGRQPHRQRWRPRTAARPERCTYRVLLMAAMRAPPDRA